MEKQLSNEEIAKVFAMYMPCEVKCGKLSGWSLSQTTYPADLRFYVENRNRDLKLLLTPLSEITDEDAIVVSNMKGFNQRNGKGEDIRAWNGRVHVLNNERFGLEIDVYMYLVSRGYSVPLFFSPGHWANSKTAIELGIAVDKTK